MSCLKEATQSAVQRINGLDFYEVIHVTESHSESGRTSLPGYWEANINYRYAPSKSMTDATKYLLSILQASGIDNKNIQIIDHAYAGTIITSPLLQAIIKRLQAPIKAKQAWTDVAQLAKLNLSCFNYGAGISDQAHKHNEFIHISAIKKYINALWKLLVGSS